MKMHIESIWTLDYQAALQSNCRHFSRNSAPVGVLLAASPCILVTLKCIECELKIKSTLFGEWFAAEHCQANNADCCVHTDCAMFTTLIIVSATRLPAFFLQLFIAPHSLRTADSLEVRVGKRPMSSNFENQKKTQRSFPSSILCCVLNNVLERMPFSSASLTFAQSAGTEHGWRVQATERIPARPGLCYRATVWIRQYEVRTDQRAAHPHRSNTQCTHIEQAGCLSG